MDRQIENGIRRAVKHSLEVDAVSGGGAEYDGLPSERELAHSTAISLKRIADALCTPAITQGEPS